MRSATTGTVVFLLCVTFGTACSMGAPSMDALADGGGVSEPDAVDGGIQTSGDASITSPPDLLCALDVNAAEFWVDAAVPTGGAGGPSCPFRTITSAIAVARLSAAPAKQIHIAAGTYDVALGETFPIVARDGISLLGAGAASTFVTGDGDLTADKVGGDPSKSFGATLVVGNATTAQTVSGIRFQPTRMSTVNGIYCVEGNLPAVPTTAANLPAPSLVVDGATLGPGYGTYGNASVSVATLTAVTPAAGTLGCNITVRATHFTKNVRGIIATFESALRIGDGTAAGSNTFELGQLASPYVYAGDIYAQGRYTSIWNNAFTSSNVPVTVFMSSSYKKTYQPRVEIKDNTVAGCYIGIYMSESGTVDELTGNQISGCSKAAMNAVDLSQVGHARNNLIIGNAAGITTDGSWGTARPMFDFGSVTDPDNNTFSCNASTSGGTGSDLFIKNPSSAPNLGAASTVSFYGNYWDHVVNGMPRTHTPNGSDPPNGTDYAIVLYSTGASVGGAKLVANPVCPAGYIAGP